MADLRCVTVEELHRLVRARLAATPGIRVRAELTLAVEEPRGQAGEVRFSTAWPDEAWVGGADGRLFRTRDDGRTWTQVGSAEMRLADGRVEAVAPHPTDPRVAYVGLYRDRLLADRLDGAAQHWRA